MTNWRNFARCRGLSNLFFPDASRDDQKDLAIRICHNCPVRRECLASTLDQENGKGRDTRYGISGGHTPTERHKMTIGKARSDLVQVHGVYESWLFGCRCTLCAATADQAPPPPRRRQLVPIPTGIHHGGTNAYERHGCRCDKCIAGAIAKGLIKQPEPLAA